MSETTLLQNLVASALAEDLPTVFSMVLAMNQDERDTVADALDLIRGTIKAVSAGVKR